jgi:hypothetical protein
MQQIEMSTGDMLANDNPSYQGTPNILKDISSAISDTCPDAASYRFDEGYRRTAAGVNCTVP